MEYIDKYGEKVIVEGDMVKRGNRPFRQNKIGANYTNGVYRGGYISSFNGSFTDELIGIETGVGDIINAKIGDIEEAYQMLDSKLNGIDRNNIFEVSRIVFEVVDEYFGGIDNIEERLNYYYSDDYLEREDNRISKLRGSGAAMCVERAALAQNLLQYLGINSFYKASGIIKNGEAEGHSYNIIEYDGKYYIFDTSLPNMIDDSISPLICEIDEETFYKLSNPLSDVGVSVRVSHYNPMRDKDVTITYDSGRDKEIEVDPIGEVSKVK